MVDEPSMIERTGAGKLAVDQDAVLAGCSSWTSKVTTEVLRMAELGHTADAQHNGLPLAGPVKGCLMPALSRRACRTR